jgi:transposase
MLTDVQWSLIQPLFPPPSNHLRGRPPLDDRLILDAVFWKICHDIAWYDLPPIFPSHQTVYRRFRQWHRLGLWHRLLHILYVDLAERGAFDLQDAFDRKIFHLHKGMNRYTVTLDPAAPTIWQVQTGWIFAWLAARNVYHRLRHPQRAFHTSIFDLTLYLANLHLEQHAEWEDAAAIVPLTPD